MQPLIFPGSPQGFRERQEDGTWLERQRPGTGDSNRRHQTQTPALEGDPECESLTPEDTSYAGSWLRYASFVGSLVAAASAVLVVTPTILMHRLRICRDGCLTLDEDLRRSLDRTVHPCDDFYAHVCKGWDSSGNPYINPLEKYRAAFSRRLVRAVLLQKIPVHSSKAREKAAGFLFRCLSQVDDRNSTIFTAFLQELGLPWPSKAPATRYQLLNTLVRSSLQYGMPMFWAFYVGRHPFLPAQNAIYMTLDLRCIQWIRDIEALSLKGNQIDYLRRCAEIVGGTGQSYSVMIRQVLSTHNEVVEMVRLFWGQDTVPQFHNLTDPELRRAVNGHLPDDSQLWPLDELVSLHPELYARLDSELLNRSSESQEQFKLFLGAYVVWALSPMVSTYLTNSMLVGMGYEQNLQEYHFLKCMDSLEMMMPVVNWHLQRDMQKSLDPTWNILRGCKVSIEAIARSYSVGFGQQVRSLLARVTADAYNMTSSWDMLDDAFAYLSNDTALPFYKLYRRSAQETAYFFKQSLHRPRHSIYHVPGIAGVRTYRLLVGREVALDHFLSSPPLYKPPRPMVVMAALIGALLVTQINVFLRLTVFYDQRFEAYPVAKLDPGALHLYMDTVRLKTALEASNLLPNVSLREAHEVYLASIAALSASSLPPDSRPQNDGGSETTLSENEHKLFWGFPLDQLYFYLHCFFQCGRTGRELQRMIAVCNVGLPAVQRFRRAFKCGPKHRLATNFTWPDIDYSSSTTPQ